MTCESVRFPNAFREFSTMLQR